MIVFRFIWMATMSIPWNCISVVQVFICRKFSAITINCSLNSAAHRWFFGMSNCQNKISLFDFSSDCDKTSSQQRAHWLPCCFYLFIFRLHNAHIPFQKRIIPSPLALHKQKEKKNYLIPFRFPFNFYAVHDCISLSEYCVCVSVANSVSSRWVTARVCALYIAAFPRSCKYYFAIFMLVFLFHLVSIRYPNFKSKHINAFQLCWCNSLNLWQNKLKIKIFIAVYSPPLASNCMHSSKCNPKTWRRKMAKEEEEEKRKNFKHLHCNNIVWYLPCAQT